jgi:hypothetical protein
MQRMNWLAASACAAAMVMGGVQFVGADDRDGADDRGERRRCSNASLKGGYGFLDGHISVPAGTPFTALGRWNFDGKGNFTNTLTFNDNGTVTHANDFGTYTVNADCTGKIFILGGTGTLEIVLVDWGKEFYELPTNPSSSVTLFSVAKKQFPDDDDNNQR